jgi:hypothetical protein
VICPTEVPNRLTSIQLNSSKMVSGFLNAIDYARLSQSFPENIIL